MAPGTTHYPGNLARDDDDPDACGYCGASALDHHLCAGYAADLASEHARLALLGTPGCNAECPECRGGALRHPPLRRIVGTTGAPGTAAGLSVGEYELLECGHTGRILRRRAEVLGRTRRCQECIGKPGQHHA